MEDDDSDDELWADFEDEIDDMMFISANLREVTPRPPSVLLPSP